MLPPGRVEVCHDCQSSLPRGAASCSSCGAAVPSSHPEFLKRFIERVPDLCDSSQLSRCLEAIGLDPQGPLEEKRERIKQHTTYILTLVTAFPDELIKYLTSLKTRAAAACVCGALDDLWSRGPRGALVRRR